MPSAERIEELRHEAFATDIEISDAMLAWTEEQVVAYFDSGGTVPAGASLDVPLFAERPVLVALYGGGQDEASGLAQIEPVVKAAVGVGIQDTLVLHQAVCFPECETFDKIMSRYQDLINADYEGRPLLIVGFSLATRVVRL